jgi:hypothetical protein
MMDSVGKTQFENKLLIREFNLDIRQKSNKKIDKII